MPTKQFGYYLVGKINLSKNKYERWLKIARELKLSKKACQRLEWMIYYETKAERNAKQTCRHFDIPRSLWYYWRKRFSETNLRTLEDEFKAPKNTRKKRIHRSAIRTSGDPAEKASPLWQSEAPKTLPKTAPNRH